MTGRLFLAAEAGMVQWSEHWYQCNQNYQGALEIYSRHYTYAGGNYAASHSIVGPGERIVLVTAEEDALFIWRREAFRMDGQQGANCAVFRNEGLTLSSGLIIEAEQLAWKRWPGERLFTFVNPTKVQSANPGYCFICAVWSRCGTTRKGLIILEKEAAQ